MRRSDAGLALLLAAVWGGCIDDRDSPRGISVSEVAVAAASIGSSAPVASGVPRVRITKTDPRPLFNVTLTANFTVAGAPHSDWETVGSFDRTINLQLNGEGATWNGTAWTGDLLSALTANPGPPVIYINKTDDRDITSLTLTVDFDTADGAHHEDYEVISPFNGLVDLQLNGAYATWNGSMYVGDLLRRGPRIRISKTDPRPITNLRLTVQGLANGASVNDYQDIGNFDHFARLGLDSRGPYQGSASDMLYSLSNGDSAGLPVVTIDDTDVASFTQVRVIADFNINGPGNPHHDYEDIGSLGVGTVELQLDGRGATWNGTQWTGDMLRPYTPPSTPDTLPDPGVNVLTQHNNSNRTGANQAETALTPANVSPGSFGKIFTLPVDGEVRAQPLYLPAETVSGATHNVVVVATMHNTVFAFDADTSAPLWQSTTLGPSFPIWNPAMCDVNGTPNCAYRDPDWGARYSGATPSYHDGAGEIGIVGTPVIDPASHRIYVVTFNYNTAYTGSAYRHYLWALDTRTGIVVAGPVQIAASVPGSGDGSVNGTVTFQSKRENQRPGLLLANGNVYIAFASYADTDFYHGWVLAYNASTLTQVAAFNTTPNAGEGGIWMAGQGPAADASGNVYVVTGNSTQTSAFPHDSSHPPVSNTAPSAGDRGESFLKLSPSLQLLDSFTPSNFKALNDADEDLASAGPVVIPNRNLIYAGGKEGVIYVTRTDGGQMGGFTPPCTPPATCPDKVLIRFQSTLPDKGSLHIHGAPVYIDLNNGTGNLDGMMYVWGESNQIRKFEISFNGSSFGWAFQGETSLSDWDISANEMPGGILSYSGSALSNGIIWANHKTGIGCPAGAYVTPIGCSGQGTFNDGQLWAFDAVTMQKLWTSNDVPLRDSLGRFAKFVPPTVANGRVYVATFSNQVVVYGLLQ